MKSIITNNNAIFPKNDIKELNSSVEINDLLCRMKVSEVRNIQDTPASTLKIINFNDNNTRCDRNKKHIYSPAADGACFFRTHLACSEKAAEWLCEKSLNEVYAWIKSKENIFVSAINNAIETIAEREYDERISTDFLINLVESKNSNELAINLLNSMMGESEFMLWRGECLSEFLKYYFDIELPSDFCNEIVDYIYQSLAEKLNICMNQNEEMYIKRLGSNDKGFHYVIVAPSNFFNNTSSDCYSTSYILSSAIESNTLNKNEETNKVVDISMTEYEAAIDSIIESEINNMHGYMLPKFIYIKWLKRNVLLKIEDYNCGLTMIDEKISHIELFDSNLLDDKLEEAYDVLFKIKARNKKSAKPTKQEYDDFTENTKEKKQKLITNSPITIKERIGGSDGSFNVKRSLLYYLRAFQSSPNYEFQYEKSEKSREEMKRSRNVLSPSYLQVKLRNLDDLINSEESKKTQSASFLQGADAKEIIKSKTGIEIEITKEYEGWLDKSNVNSKIKKTDFKSKENKLERKAHKRVKRRFLDTDSPQHFMKLLFTDENYQIINSNLLSEIQLILEDSQGEFKTNDETLIKRCQKIIELMIGAAKENPELNDCFNDVLDAIQIFLLENSDDFRKGYDYYMRKNNDEMIKNKQCYYHEVVESELIKTINVQYFQNIEFGIEESKVKSFTLLSNVLHAQSLNLELNYEALGMAFANQDLNNYFRTLKGFNEVNRVKSNEWSKLIISGEMKSKHDYFKNELLKDNLNIEVSEPVFFSQYLSLMKSAGSALNNMGYCHYLTNAYLIGMASGDVKNYAAVMDKISEIKNLLINDHLTAYRIFSGMSEINQELQFLSILDPHTQISNFENELGNIETDYNQMIDELWNSKHGTRIIINNEHTIGIGKVKVLNGDTLSVLLDVNVGSVPCYEKKQFEKEMMEMLVRTCQYNPDDKALLSIEIKTLTMTSDTIKLLKTLVTNRGLAYKNLITLDLNAFVWQPMVSQHPSWNSIFPNVIISKNNELTTDIVSRKRYINKIGDVNLNVVYSEVLNSICKIKASDLSNEQIKIDFDDSSLVHVDRLLLEDEKVSLLDHVVIMKDNVDKVFTTESSRINFQLTSSDRPPMLQEKISISVSQESKVDSEMAGDLIFKQLLSFQDGDAPIVEPPIESSAQEILKVTIKKQQAVDSSLQHSSEDSIQSRRVLKYLSDDSKQPPFISKKVINTYLDVELTKVDIDSLKVIELENYKIGQQMAHLSESFSHLITENGHDPSDFRIDKNIDSTDSSFVSFIKNGMEDVKIKIQLPENIRMEFQAVKKIVDFRVNEYKFAMIELGNTRPAKFAVKSLKVYGKGIGAVAKVMSVINMVSLIEQTNDFNNLNKMAKTGLVLNLFDLSIDTVSNTLEMVNFAVKNIVGPVQQLSRVARMSSSVSLGASLVFNFMEIGLHSYSYHHAESELERELATLYLACSIASTTLTLATIAISSAFPPAAPLLATLGFVITIIQTNEMNRILAKNIAKIAFIGFEEELEALTLLIMNMNKITFDEETENLIIVSTKIPYLHLKLSADNAEMIRDGEIFGTRFFKTIFTNIESNIQYPPESILEKLKHSPFDDMENLPQWLTILEKIELSLQAVQDANFEKCLVTSPYAGNEMLNVKFKKKEHNLINSGPKHIVIPGHSVRPIYTTSTCTTASFGGHIYHVPQKLVNQLNSCPNSSWRIRKNLLVDAKSGGDSLFVGKVSLFEMSNLDLFYSSWYEWTAKNKKCFLVPNEINLQIIESKYVLNADNGTVVIYHFLRDELALNYYYNKNKIPFGISEKYSLPLAPMPMNDEEKILDYHIELIRNGNSNLYLHSGTKLNISEDESSGPDENSIVNLFIPYNSIGSSTKKLTNAKTINRNRCLTITQIESNKPIFSEESPDILVTLDESVKRKVHINLIEEEDGKESTVYVMILRDAYPDDLKFDLSSISSLEFDSNSRANTLLLKMLQNLDNKIFGFISEGFKIQDIILNCDYHKFFAKQEESNVNTLFEASGWYFKGNKENKNISTGHEGVGKLVTKIWRKKIPEDLKYIFRRMEYIGQTSTKYDDIPPELKFNFNYNDIVPVNNFYDTKTNTLIKQFGDTEIRYWSHEDIRKCSEGSIPQQINWGGNLTESFSCGGIHLSPNIHHRGITSDRVHMLIDSLNIISDFNGKKQNENLFQFIMRESNLFFNRLSHDLDETKVENIEVITSYFMDIKNLKIGNEKQPSPTVILVNDEKLGLAIIPECEILIAVPKNASYVLSLSPMTIEEVMKLSNLPSVTEIKKACNFTPVSTEINPNYCYFLKFSNENKRSKQLNENRFLYKIITRKLISGDDLDSVSNAFLLNKSIPIFPESLILPPEILLDEFPVNKVTNMPDQKRFICNDIHGITFSLSHNLTEMGLHGVKEGYLNSKKIDPNSEVEVRKEFNKLQKKYGKSAYQYFKMKEGNFDFFNLCEPSVRININTKKVIYVPTFFNVEGVKTEISEDCLIISEGAFGLNSAAKLLIQDVKNKKIYEVLDPYSSESKVIDSFPYQYLEKSVVNEQIYISVPSIKNTTTSIPNLKLPFLGLKHLVLMPEFIDFGNVEQNIEITELMQYYLNSLTLVVPSAPNYVVQKITINTEETNMPKAIIQKFGNGSNRTFIVLPTAKKVNNISVSSEPLVLVLDYAFLNITELAHAFNEKIMFNGRYLDIEKLINEATMIDMEMQDDSED